LILSREWLDGILDRGISCGRWRALIFREVLDFTFLNEYWKVKVFE
jgi:hypothetical protein